MAQKWLVKVYENNKHAYNEGFWTRKQAVAFIDKVTSSHHKWSAELIRLGTAQ
jgi:hypothetical protein